MSAESDMYRQYKRSIITTQVATLSSESNNTVSKVFYGCYRRTTLIVPDFLLSSWPTHNLLKSQSKVCKANYLAIKVWQE
jgi:hypothetical protein